MHTRSHLRILAAASDGRSILVESTLYGPEGGGSYSIGLYSADQPYRRGFRFSSNFSNGSAARPQTVSAAECERALKDLRQALRTKRFHGVRVAATCAQRQDLVEVDTAEQVRAGELKFIDGAEGLTRGSWRIDRREQGFQLSGPGGSAELAPYFRLEQIEVFGTPDMRVIVMLNRNDAGETTLAGAWVVPQSFPQTLIQIPQRGP